MCYKGVIIRLTPTFPGAGYPDKYTMKNVVESTLRICNRCIPEAVAGVSPAVLLFCVSSFIIC